MSLTQQHIEEDLSRSYVQAVAAKAGVILSLGARNHDYKVDGTFHQVSYLDKKRYESGFRLDFQLKASINTTSNDTTIKYDLDAETYNIHVGRNNDKSAPPIILLILVLPRNPDTWLSLSENELILKRCCYWAHLTGTKTTNQKTQRIEIMRSNQLTPQQVIQFLEKLSRGDSL